MSRPEERLLSRMEEIRAVPRWTKHDDEDDVFNEARVQVEEIRKAPPRTRFPSEERLVVEYRALLHRRIDRLNDTAERWNRNLTDEEQVSYDALQFEFDALAADGPVSTQQTMEVSP